MLHLNLHFGLIALILLLAFLAGFFVRSLNISYLRNQVLELERDKMLDHAEILQLQKKIAEKQKKPAARTSTPVVALKENGQPEGGKNRLASQ
ncbi:MAG: hypothetical protein QM664_13760 [Flavihumibacter sp.]